MKRVILLITMCIQLFINSQPSAKETSIMIKPEKPKSGDKITITINNDEYELSNETKFEISVYLWSSKSDNELKIEKANSYEFKKVNDKYSIVLNTTYETDFIAFQIWMNDDKVIHKQVIRFYDENGIETIGSQLGYASYLSYWGKSTVKIEPDFKQAFEIMKSVFTEYPELKIKFLPEYLPAMYGALKKEEHKTKLVKELEALEKRDDLNYESYYNIIFLYTKLKIMDKVDEITKRTIKKYPKSDIALTEFYKQISSEPDLQKQLDLSLKMIKEFPDNSRNITGLYLVIEKMIKEDKVDRLQDLLVKNNSLVEYDGIRRRIVNNLLKVGKELQFASQTAKKSVDYYRNLLQKPQTEKRSFQTEKDAIQSIKSALAYSLLLYGETLYKLGKTEEALKQFIEADTYKVWKNWQSVQLELYVTCLLDMQYYDSAESIIEYTIRESKASADMKELLKRVYEHKNGNQEGYDKYLENIENIGRKGLTEKLKKEMINEPAPLFTLNDLNGKEVSLTNYKGKVVILDFWATWCSTCKASFPGMQKIVNIYADDKDVVFLFIDTRETTNDVENIVSKFFKEFKYSFYVLLDKENKTYSDYKVTVIPTKFIIDKEGNIQFKKIGYDGDINAMIEETKNMISMLK